MDCKLGINLNNNYHVELINSVTGDIKQQGDFSNIAVIGIGDYFTGNANGSYNILYALALGSSSNQPSYADTALGSQLFQVVGGTASYEWLDDYTLKGVNTFTFPATSSYVGTIREAGLKFNYDNTSIGKLVTHALFTDSEGQPISFQKTDLDILIVTVTVEASIASSDQNFTIVKKAPALSGLLGSFDIKFTRFSPSLKSVFGVLSAWRFIDDVESDSLTYGGTGADYKPYPDQCSDSIINDVSMSSVTAVSTASDTYISIPKYRMASTFVTSETYFVAIALPGIGYWKFPNTTSLPAYTIEDIDIGTGDGSKVNFDNPLSYFKANTDKVYKNGIQLTRGIDYTINNISNKGRLPEIAQFIKPIKAVSGYKNDTEYWKDMKSSNGSSGLFHNICVPFKKGMKLIKDINTDVECYGFDSNNPIYIEYENAETFNFFRCNSMIIVKLTKSSLSGGYVNGPTSTIYIDYSLDGSEYTNIASGALATYSEDNQTYSRVTIDFNATTAKYWRIRTNYSYTSTSEARLLTSKNHSATLAINTTHGFAGMFLGKRDPYITFTTPPAEGDLLTMDVDMDLIFKNSNFVVDATERIDFSV